MEPLVFYVIQDLCCLSCQEQKSIRLELEAKPERRDGGRFLGEFLMSDLKVFSPTALGGASTNAGSSVSCNQEARLLVERSGR